MQGRFGGDGQVKHIIAAQGSPLEPIAPHLQMSGIASLSQWESLFTFINTVLYVG